MKTVILKNGFMNAGKIKISSNGDIILQFENYHHVIDSDTELCYANQVEEKIEELEQTLQYNFDCFLEELQKHFQAKRALWLARYGIGIAWYAKWGREDPNKIFYMNGRTFGWMKERWKKVALYWKRKYDNAPKDD